MESRARTFTQRQVREIQRTLGSLVGYWSELYTWKFFSISKKLFWIFIVNIFSVVLGIRFLLKNYCQILILFGCIKSSQLLHEPLTESLNKIRSKTINFSLFPSLIINHDNVFQIFNQPRPQSANPLRDSTRHGQIHLHCGKQARGVCGQRTTARRG